jgi:putative transcriptional regulator
MAKTNFQNEVVNRIRQLRLDNDISQIQLANIIDVSNGQIGNIESPKFQHKYTLKHLYTIARHFNVPLEFILTGSNSKMDSELLIKTLIQYDE